MPYIKEEERTEERVELYRVGSEAEHVGVLNYMITRMVLGYIKTHGLRYEVLNAVIGVLTCVIQEVYRRFITPYEHAKMFENGDVIQREEINEWV